MWMWLRMSAPGSGFDVHDHLLEPACRGPEHRATVGSGCDTSRDFGGPDADPATNRRETPAGSARRYQSVFPAVAARALVGGAAVGAAPEDDLALAGGHLEHPGGVPVDDPGAELPTGGAGPAQAIEALVGTAHGPATGNPAASPRRALADRCCRGIWIAMGHHRLLRPGVEWDIRPIGRPAAIKASRWAEDSPVGQHRRRGRRQRTEWWLWRRARVGVGWSSVSARLQRALSGVPPGLAGRRNDHHQPHLGG